MILRKIVLSRPESIELKKLSKKCHSITKLPKKGKLTRSSSASIYQKATSNLSFNKREISLSSKLRA